MPNNNRGDLKTKKRTLSYEASTLETIDFAVFEWLNEKIKVFCSTNAGWKKVPVIWVSPERSFQVKKDNKWRDITGTLVFPAITLERTGVSKDLTRKGYWYGRGEQGTDFKGGSLVVARRVQHEKTSNFANADAYRKANETVGPGQINFPRKNKKIVYETVTVPMPVYVDVTYKIVFRSAF